MSRSCCEEGIEDSFPVVNVVCVLQQFIQASPFCLGKMKGVKLKGVPRWGQGMWLVGEAVKDICNVLRL